MKTVFNVKDLPHVWAKQEQSHGRTSTNSMFFRDRVIFSYGEHYPLAAFHTLPNGQKIVLINNSYASVTTARHRSAVWHATSQYSRYYVSNLYNDGSINFTRELENTQTSFVSRQKKIARARTNQTWLIEQYIADFNRVKHFLYDIVPYIVPDYDIEQVNTTLDIITLTGNLEDLKNTLLEQARKEKAERIAKEKKRHEAWLKQLADWQQNKIDRLGYSPLDSQTYLRLLNNEIVETSKGIRLHVDVFSNLYAAIHAGKNVIGFEVLTSSGKFKIETLNNEIIKSGCHTVPVTELHRIADSITRGVKHHG